ERSPVQNAQADRLVRIQQTGQLSAITIELLKFRDLVEEKFELEFEAIRSMFKFSLKKCDQQVQDRLLYNHLIPVTIMAILANHLDFGWKYEALADFALENLIAQQQAIYNEDELTVWWRIIQYLVDRFDLRHGTDIQVEEKSSEKFYSLTTNSDSEVWTWEESKRLLYFRFTTAHQEYLERHQRTRGKRGLDLEAIKYYLQNSPAYLGRKKAKKFGPDKTYSCWVFDMDLLPLEIPLSLEVGREEVEEEEKAF
ncbi:MAG: hypothetical protein KDC84_15720, partial [Crocinitomicaceae bacterium]|nr:hypothetical protein [Crocinitomicaceae bacterium]